MRGLLIVAILCLAAAKGGANSVESRQSQSSSKPDVYLGFLDWDSMKPFKPFTEQFRQTVSPYTQQISQLLLDRVPGAESIYTQFDQAGNQITSQFNPANLMGQLGSGGGSGGGSASSGQLMGLLNPSNFLGGGGGGNSGGSSGSARSLISSNFGRRL